AAPPPPASGFWPSGHSADFGFAGGKRDDRDPFQSVHARSGDIMQKLVLAGIATMGAYALYSWFERRKAAKEADNTARTEAPQAQATAKPLATTTVPADERAVPRESVSVTPRVEEAPPQVEAPAVQVEREASVAMKDAGV